MKNIVITIAMLSFLTGYAQAETRQVALTRNIYPKSSQGLFPHSQVDQKLVNWLKGNVSKETRLPFSFEIPVESKKGVYGNMGGQFSVGGIIERVMVEEGLVIYDGAVRQIVLAMLGGGENLEESYRLTQVLWEGGLGELFNLRAGYPINNFVYDPKNPEAVSSNLEDKGKRGFIFRIINANGRYNTKDPLDGKTEFKDFPTWPTVHWEDWKPIAGENAWISMAALHLYHKKYYHEPTRVYRSNGAEAVELKLAQELARAAMLLQADNGGIRMAPIGTFLTENDKGEGWYNLISTENNLSWYAAFRMLYQITKNEEYKAVLDRLDAYFKSVWNAEEGYFYQGMTYRNGAWEPEKKNFATDVQTWGILVLSPKTIDSWFGQGASYRMWEATKAKAGSRDSKENLLGVGFTTENDRISVEWTAGAIFATRLLEDYYANDSRQWSQIAAMDSVSMRQGIESLRVDFPDKRAAYSYSSKRAWIPFGWYSHCPDVLSLASTAWVVLLDANFNPFYLFEPKNVSPEIKVAEIE